MFELFHRNDWKHYNAYDVKEIDENIYFLVYYQGMWTWVNSSEFLPSSGGRS